MRCKNQKEIKQNLKKDFLSFPTKLGKKQILSHSNFLKLKNQRGQVWIETVIYTLIAFAMIGLVLSYAKPKIEGFQDQAIIEQTIKTMDEINSIILDVDQNGPGNKRKIDLTLKKGTLKIDSIKDEIVFQMDSKCEYSEQNQEINNSGLIIFTKKKGKINVINLTKTYSNYNLSYNNKQEEKLITKSPTPYILFISNEGEDREKTMINFEIN